ncbi:hypothetical protein CYMTET_41823 [Cymbomonas tetramitiformis]|uniref:Phosphatidylinositol 3,4,5-trisphosphate 3-phosphatase and dual-specificity protein phosphatase PTEN n=1 Tax=Cymbomonas tetramitiformis TaxID=36881 RepID=A0AAE0F374_9CHLO|nr:hypothetical protein CYMTET_41823 [Cymbomonas tetramitiformis]
MSSIIRSLVSKKKRRFQQEGFDLDLTYVTERIIAMGYPSEGREGYYRNPMSEVVRFLNKRHPGKYRVYNLCSEREYKTHFFEDRVARYPFPDHQAPTVECMVQFCEDADNWLNDDPGNVFIAHCKAGKGRTGVMICCYLLHCKRFSDPDAAMKFYALMRTKNGKGVTIASQARYINYYAKYLEEGMRPERFIELSKLVLRMPEELNLIVVLYQRHPVSQEVVPKLSSQPAECGAEMSSNFEVVRESGGYVLRASKTLFISGDVKFEFFDGSISKKHSLFYMWFNTSYLPVDGPEVFQSKSLDKVRKSLDKSLELKVHFIDAPKSIALELNSNPSPSGGRAMSRTIIEEGLPRTLSSAPASPSASKHCTSSGPGAEDSLTSLKSSSDKLNAKGKPDTIEQRTFSTSDNHHYKEIFAGPGEKMPTETVPDGPVTLQNTLITWFGGPQQGAAGEEESDYEESDSEDEDGTHLEHGENTAENVIIALDNSVEKMRKIMDALKSEREASVNMQKRLDGIVQRLAAQ